MDLVASVDSEARFAAYVEALVGVIGHADRALPLRDYCLGLLMPVRRKSVEPMAAITAPTRVAAQHQSLLHFVGNGPWSDQAVLSKVRELVLPTIERHGPIEAWIIDDTGFPKKGRHSVGVALQYCGQLGKQDNCQVAVTLSLANHYASLPIAYRLYLPQDWAADAERRRQAKVPRTVGFQSKPEIALDQLRAACAAGVPRGVVLMDAGYGNHSQLRAAVTGLDLSYVAGIGSSTSVWARQCMNFAGEDAGFVLPVALLLFISRTKRSGSANGMGLSTTAFTTEKIAVLAPMPSVSAATAVAVKPGLSRNILSACFRSWRRVCI